MHTATVGTVMETTIMEVVMKVALAKLSDTSNLQVAPPTTTVIAAMKAIKLLPNMQTSCPTYQSLHTTNGGTKYGIDTRSYFFYLQTCVDGNMEKLRSMH